MKDDLSLQLQLIEQANWGYRFQLNVANRSSDRLFIPDLELTDLRFRGVDHPKPLDWGTYETVSALSGGSTIEPGATLKHNLYVRPCAVEDGAFSSPDWDYDRWCLSLFQGEYNVWYELLVDHTYFNLDSHLRFPQIEKMAKENNARLWCGSVQSNVLSVYHV